MGERKIVIFLSKSQIAKLQIFGPQDYIVNLEILLAYVAYRSSKSCHFFINERLGLIHFFNQHLNKISDLEKTLIENGDDLFFCVTYFLNLCFTKLGKCILTSFDISYC